VKEFSPYKDEFFNSLKHYTIKEKSYIIHTLQCGICLYIIPVRESYAAYPCSLTIVV